MIMTLAVFLLLILISFVTCHPQLLVTKAADVSNMQNIFGNTFTDTSAITLDSEDLNVNKLFKITNMLPGDTFSQDYILSMKNPMDADIKIEIVRTSAITDYDLAKKLNVKITTEDNQNNKAFVYEGSMADFVNKPVMISVNAKSTNLIYNISVGLPKETGNEYQNQNFSGNMKWEVINGMPTTNPNTGYKNRSFIIIAICLIISILFIYSSQKKQLLLK